MIPVAVNGENDSLKTTSEAEEEEVKSGPNTSRPDHRLVEKDQENAARLVICWEVGNLQLHGNYDQTKWAQAATKKKKWHKSP